MITAKVELITPEVAKQLLENNHHNRKVSKGNTETIERALKSGEWKVSGQTIIVSITGILMDGQHRLKAVMNTGISMEHLVCRGVADDVFKVIDTGKNRSGADVLSIAKIDNHGKIANLIKFLDAYKNKHMTRATKFSNTQLLAMYETKPDFYQDLLTDGEQLARECNVKLFNDYQLAVMGYSFKDYDMGDEYLLNVLQCEVLKPSEHTEVTHQVKNKLIGLHKEDSNRVTQEQKYYIIYEGYKHYLEGTMFTTVTTHTIKELRKVSKAIPYL